MFKVIAVTPWIVHDGEHIAEIHVDYPAFAFSDITWQPEENLTPEPNAFVVSGVCDQATLDAIEADSTYQILSSEEIINE